MTQDEAQATIGRYLLPGLGILALLFTLITGVPWVSKVEFTLHRETRDQQWRGQYETNQRVDKHLDQIETDLDRVQDQIRELRDAATKAGWVGRTR